MTRYCLIILLLAAALSLSSCKNDNSTGGEQPTVTGMTPGQVFAGQENIDGQINGSRFSGIIAVNLGDGIRIHETQIVSPNQIAVRFSVDSNAAPGKRTITVTTPGGVATNGEVLSIGDNKPPVAKFSISPSRFGINQPIEFNASNSNDPDGRITEYSWDFGDGKKAKGKLVSHRYGSSGNYTAGLKVTDNKNGESIATKVIEVEKNRPPVPHFDISPNIGNVGTNFRFDASNSTDDKRIVKYAWLFGDGRRDQGKVVHHRFNRISEFNVELTVTDSSGLANSLSKKLEIKGKPPVARFNIFPGSTGDINTSFEFDASVSYDTDGNIIGRIWDFGDGNVHDGISPEHKYGKKGTFLTKLTVTDNSGLKDTASRTINVTEPLPPPPPPPPGGQTCTARVSKKSPDLYGRVLAVDPGNKIITIKLHTTQSCATAFYKCGDVKRFLPVGEDWFGTICRMVYLGNNTFRVYMVKGNGNWPVVGMTDVYLHWQTCGGGFCP